MLSTDPNATAGAICVDSNENVYVAYCTPGGHKIRKFDSSGNEDTINWNKTGFYCSEAAVDQDDNVYVAGRGNNGGADKWHIKKFNPDGTEITSRGWPFLDVEGAYNEVNAIAFDSSENVYAVGNSSDDWHIKKFSASGLVDAGWNITVADTRTCQSVALDSNGRVYVTGQSFPSGVNYLESRRYLSDGSEDAGWYISQDSGNSPDKGVQVLVDENNDVVLSGVWNGDELWLVRYNAAGAVVWDKTGELYERTGNSNVQYMAFIGN